MYRTPFLYTNRLELFKVDKDHCNNDYLSWLHDSEVNHFLETGYYPQSLEELEQFVDNVYKKEVLFLAIHTKEDGKHIGNIKIDSINRIHQIAEYGILLGDKSAWGKGYAKEASEVVLMHCFKKLNLRKITLGVIADNTSAIKLYKEKLNFLEEGKYVKHVFFDGKYCDTVRMATFKEQWI